MGTHEIFSQRFLRSVYEEFILKLSFKVIVGIHEKLEKFQNISIEDFSENLQ
jgi:hypothetical protein